MPSPPSPPDLLAVRADFPRYSAPLLFVPGLWADASLWHAAMSLLAQRGWDSFAVALPRPPHADWPDWHDRVLGAFHALPAPAVIIGHDVGVLLGLEAAGAARAVVGLAPFLPNLFRAAAPRLVSPWSLQWAAWRGQSLPPPEVVARELPPPGGWCGASARIVRWATTWLPPTDGPHQPRLLVAGAGDVLCPAESLTPFAAACRAELAIMAAAGHALPWGRGWDRHLAHVHRWLVRNLGAELLLESDTGEETT